MPLHPLQESLVDVRTVRYDARRQTKALCVYNPGFNVWMEHWFSTNKVDFFYTRRGQHFKELASFIRRHDWRRLEVFKPCIAKPTIIVASFETMPVYCLRRLRFSFVFVFVLILIFHFTNLLGSLFLVANGISPFKETKSLRWLALVCDSHNVKSQLCA